MTQDTLHSRPYLKGHLYETGTRSWSLPFFTSYIILTLFPKVTVFERVGCSYNFI